MLDDVDVAGAQRDLGFQVRVLPGQHVACALELEVRADARCQHHRADGLGHVVHGAGAQALLLVDRFDLGRDEDHRDGGRQRIGHQVPQHLHAVHARHHHVQQDEAGLRDHRR
ncbi:MAG: hypothetical protein KAY46_26075, partial [Burkholderiaceae bacterium]|nr:hypothetical protein [Burkholderiaceae bacterium]